MGRKRITLDNGKLDPELQKRIDDYKKAARAKRKNNVIEADDETKSRLVSEIEPRDGVIYRDLQDALNGVE
jgi:2',3'-cyclic-nucleotide 2'-phosphodiesterase (5'-nucleotidase family)